MLNFVSSSQATNVDTVTHEDTILLDLLEPCRGPVPVPILQWQACLVRTAYSSPGLRYPTVSSRRDDGADLCSLATEILALMSPSTTEGGLRGRGSSCLHPRFTSTAVCVNAVFVLGHCLAQEHLPWVLGGRRATNSVLVAMAKLVRGELGVKHDD